MSESLLFSPLQIKGMLVKNRICFCPMVTNHAGPNGEVVDKLIRYHEERAKGGCGLNMLEAAYVAQDGKSYFRGVGLSEDAFIPGLKRLTDAVHRCGGKIGVQLQHGGRTANPAFSGRPVLLVSAIPGVTPDECSREIDGDDIERLVADYAEAARRAVEARFDGVEVHCAHGYLPIQFLSPLTNRRTDGYGGTFENRLRFPLRVLSAVRKAVPETYPVVVRLSVEELVAGGLRLEEGLEAAKRLVDCGADALSVSVGTTESNHFVIPPGRVPPGWNADRAGAVRRAVQAKVPVIVAGRNNTGEVAERILREGKADMIGMGRALIADPWMPSKLLSGRPEDVRPCVACNDGCAEAMSRMVPLGCAVNPRAGREGRFPRDKAAARRAILIIGGGPAGLKSLVACDERRERHGLSARRKAVVRSVGLTR